MNEIIKRLREPSTWAGISTFALLFGVPVAHVDAVGGIVAAVSAAAAVFLKEKAAQ